MPRSPRSSGTPTPPPGEPLVRPAALEHRLALLEYQHQRDTAKHERLLLALEAGHQLGVPPPIYGVPMGLRGRRAVCHRRTSLARRRPAAGVADLGTEGRAQEWLDEHAAELRAPADILIDHRGVLMLLVEDGVVRSELTRNIDEAGEAHELAAPSMEFRGAVAYAVSCPTNPHAGPGRFRR
jgi:hypothetical protein